jgi:hypothetical protein
MGKQSLLYRSLHALIEKASILARRPDLAERMTKVDQAIQEFSDDVRWQGDLTDERRTILLACCDLYLRFVFVLSDYLDFEIRRVHHMLLDIGRYDEKDDTDPG